MTDLTDACADLEAWLPALAQALARDNTPAGGRPVLSAGGVVNPDVLHAMLTLAREVPAACAAAAELTGERWPPRPLATCLRNLPRLHDRLEHHMPGAAMTIERQVFHWTATVKYALGLREPDRPIGWNCPLHHEPSPLLAVGAEGTLTDGHTVVWQHAAVIVCRHCGAEWSRLQWEHLGLILESA